VQRFDLAERVDGPISLDAPLIIAKVFCRVLNGMSSPLWVFV
jgi:hypothetical protein